MRRCFLCGATNKIQIHHKFSQTKLNKKLYGDLIHHYRNTIFLCADCHLNKAIPKFTEKEFCNALQIEPKSKSEKFKKIIDKKRGEY